ncbi:hypothetical protein P1P91_05895 [Halomonas piscis]|uniref:Uncharacterized protein n=1 Tax=Halomonas piscis TaxID=3031727 RepID=A0ABY9Z3J6_9GAMM|nr:hypothetical protein [Halomonas piscis]WNK21205.1 hypothetical protein P1P91_05895 [Halomonas piscis]
MSKMIIFDEKVSFRTQVRVAQVHAMIKACRQLQSAYRAFQSGAIRITLPGQVGTQQMQEAWLTSTEPFLLDILSNFRHVALSNHFVCGNWETCDKLEADDPNYLSRDALRHPIDTRARIPIRRSGPNLLPQAPDFMWLRRFIHSVVTWDITAAEGEMPIRDVALCTDNWDVIADQLEHELDKAVGPDHDPWHWVRPQNSS